jgi:hypothetical protein
MDEACRTHENHGKPTKSLVVIYEAEISRCRWKDVTKIEVKERVEDGVFWIQFPKDRKIICYFEHGNEHSDTIKCLENILIPEDLLAPQCTF